MKFRKKKGRAKIVVAFLALFQILGLISSFHAVLGTRTAQGAVAWVIGLNTAPVVAVPAYWILGRSKFEGYVDARRDSSLDIDDDLEKIYRAMEPYEINMSSHLPEYQAVINLANTPFLKGNEVTLLVDGEATYDSIYQGIEAASDYVLFQFYILRSDDSGNRFKELLIRKAGEGVDVFVLYDELGSAGLKPDWLEGFRQAGIQIIPFNTRQGKRNRFQINFRNHRKIVVVDGSSAWIGGLNVGDEYLGENPDLSPWRDTHLRIDGPAVLEAQAIFVSDWHWASKNLLEGLNWQPRPAAGLAEGSDGTVMLVLGSGPADDVETASLFFTNALNAARRRIWIATPYFIPDEATMVALRLAVLKGLDVRIITPRLYDNWFVSNAAKVYLSELSQLGAKIYYFEKGFMHQKVMLLDDNISIVGTVNFDNRSFRLNFEVSGVIAGEEFNAELESMLLDDLANSTELRSFDLEEESFWTRLKAHGSSLLAPVL